MLKIALFGTFLQLVLQTGITEANICENISHGIKNRTLAYSLLCSKYSQYLRSCCYTILQDLQWHKISYQTLCQHHVHKSCAHLYKFGERKDGVYTIDPDGKGPFQVRCDMTRDGGGWTVFERRQDGTENFDRGWSDYKAGFGQPAGEFWLGLDKLHRLSKSSQNVLRVDLMDFNGVQRYAKYKKFSVANELDKYRLTIGSYSGNAGDSLTWHNNARFSTKDSDHDTSSGNCALNWKGGWWYKSCARANLNGLYLGKGKNHYSGNHWRNWKMDSLKEVEMKLRADHI